MLSFFRNSKASKFVLGIFGVVMAGILITGVGSGSSGLSSLGRWFTADPNTLASVGSQTVSAPEVQQLMTQVLEAQHQQQPGITMDALVSHGIVEKVIDENVGRRAIEVFGQAHGMRVGKEAVDKEIELLPGMTGADGKFNHDLLLQKLSAAHISEQQLRDDVARGLLERALVTPISAGAVMPNGVADRYAAVLLEQREGRVVAVPGTKMPNIAAPTAAAVAQYYKANAAHYTVPERRVIEYIVYPKAQFMAQAQPSDAEIAAAYKKDAYKYSAKDLRDLTQLIVPDEAKAKSALAKIRGGASFDAVAKGMGLEAVRLSNQDRKAYAGLSSDSVAESVFSTPKGAFAPIAKSPFGWHLVRVDTLTHDAGKTLAQAHDEIAKAIALTRIEEVYAAFQNKVQDRATHGANMAALAKAYGGTIITTHPVNAVGVDPDDATYKLPDDIKPVLRDAFNPETRVNSDPLIVPVTKERDKVALYHVRGIVQAGPKPLATIQAQVAADALRDAQSAAAKRVALAVVAQVNQGKRFEDAVAHAGVALPAIAPMKASRIALAQRQDVPAPIRELFNLPLHKAKVTEAPDNQGWYVLVYDKATPANDAARAQLVPQVRQQYGAGYRDEMAAGLMAAAKAGAGVKHYPDALARFKAALVSNQTQ